MHNTVDNPCTPDDGAGRAAAALLAPLVQLAAAIDEADLLNVDLPLDMPGLLEAFLDPEVQEAIPECLRAAADAYLDSLPGHRAGDFARAGEAHRALLDLWNGEAMVAEEAEFIELGLEREDMEDGRG